RIGRTGRAGKTGVAVSFCPSREKVKIARVEELSGVKLSFEKPPALQDVEAESLENRVSAPASMRTLYISGGRKDKVRPGDILGALTGEAGGFTAAQVGKIEIHDTFSYVALAADIFDRALECLKEGKIKGRRFKIEPVK
ncbi:MAG: ATP-dependent RNA helicase DbpA, partial [Proteobacteria bacterium]